MKKILAIALCIASLLCLAPAALAVNEDVTGEVVIYTSMYPFVIDMMDEALKAEFPNLTPGNNGSFLVAEPAYSLELKEGGWLHAYETEAAQNLRFDYDKEGYWYPVRVCNMVLAYNPELKTPDQLPKTFKEFAEDTSLKGRISMGNPLSSGTTMAAVASLSDKYGYEYFTALGQNDVMIESGSTALAKLQTGECDVIMILEESVLKERKDNGSKISCIYPEDGVILIPSTVMTVAEEKSKNLNIEACEAITDFLLSEEGQKFMVAGYMHSVLKGFTEVPFDSVDTDGLIEKDMGVDWERCYKQREEIRTKFQEAVTIKK